MDSEGSGSAGQPFLEVANSSPDNSVDLGTGNVLRNNVGVIYGSGAGYAPLVFPAVGTLNYISKWVFDTNTMYLNNPDRAGSPMYGVVIGGAVQWGKTFTCAEYSSAGVTSQAGCAFADPKFTAASIANWQTPGAFNLRLSSSSPALQAASNTLVPLFDFSGAGFSASAPGLGAYAGPDLGAAPISACDINGDGVVNLSDVQIATNQALGISACGTADLQRNGQCTVVGIQRVISAVGGGACVTGN
jgi:hypothetical protein